MDLGHLRKLRGWQLAKIISTWGHAFSLNVGPVSKLLLHASNYVSLAFGLKTLRPAYVCGRLRVKVENIYRDEMEVQATRSGENLRLRVTGAEESDIMPGFVLSSIKSPVPAVTQFEVQLMIVELLDHNSIFTVCTSLSVQYALFAAYLYPCCCARTRLTLGPSQTLLCTVHVCLTGGLQEHPAHSHCGGGVRGDQADSGGGPQDQGAEESKVCQGGRRLHLPHLSREAHLH